jgi:hypothetical protein
MKFLLFENIAVEPVVCAQGVFFNYSLRYPELADPLRSILHLWP